MPVITITGGTGNIGQRLCRLLIHRGYEVIVLGRKIPESAQQLEQVRYLRWDIAEQEISAEAISEADGIIHLAGAGIADGRWTAARKREITESRSRSAALIVKALSDIPNKVKWVLSASAIGYYGGDEELRSDKGFGEEDAPGGDFLAQTCIDWENSIKPVEKLGKRLVILRTGIVLDTGSGAYAAFVRPLKAGLCTSMGSGGQMMSWIHIEDLCRMYVYALEHAELSGVYNAVAPEPVPNKKLMETIARTRNSFFIPVHVPALLLRIGLGAMSVEVLKSCTVNAGKILEAGFEFRYPALREAAEQLAGK